MTNVASAQINPLAVLAVEKKMPRRYTLAEYLRREENSSERHEYYDGIIKKVPMARTPHNLIITNVSTALDTVFENQNKDFYVMSNSQLVYLPGLNFSLYPDVLVVAENLMHFDTNQVLLINPILIVAVLSRSTRSYDRKQKFEEYKTLDSFKEYVLVDQNNCFVETRFRKRPDTWVENQYTSLNDSVVLNSVGCSIDVAKIYRRIVLK